MRRFLRLAAATCGVVALAAAPASADVLVDPPSKHLTTSGCIALGVWYQSYSGGPRTVRVSVYYRGGLKARRTLRATTRWGCRAASAGSAPSDRAPGSGTSRRRTARRRARAG